MNVRGREKYLRTYGISPQRPLVAASVEGIEQAVVIPALAERDSLFRTLASIARNRASDLQRTLVICVVNNHRRPLTADAEFADNQKTLPILQSLVFRRPVHPDLSDGIRGDLQSVAGSDLRLAFIDASSPGLEIPDRDGGVGTARKIGMDAALGIVDARAAGGGVICCLDADTLVEENYLSAFRVYFTQAGDPAAVAAYAHQASDNPRLMAAICCYEIFLRSYVIGLSYAASPYAFHSIGSTMACSAEGYLDVRGMNRRRAAEDFHFLNKLAKIGRIGAITETTVFPSPRPSGRVPFGTGRRMLRFLTGGVDEYRLYDPMIFVILKKWLAAMEADPDRDLEAILAGARRIHACLEEYLRLSRFAEGWNLIRKNCRDTGQLRRQFPVWFDGLKTLKMVHHLSQSAFPLIPMFDGLKKLIALWDRPLSRVITYEGIPKLDEQFRILETLRSDFPHS
ncbi:MAG: glycosyltransferase family 2 protein [Deltaproteobacteria bacterium]|nr:glycosyltransferase family 2 protein [Deltaproteobacteria bacterium]